MHLYMSPDIDECSLQLDYCNDTEDCINTEGGFECMCEPGFTRVPGGCTGELWGGGGGGELRLTLRQACFCN